MIVEESFAINRSAAELYGFWRDLERLPMVTPELMSVRMVDHRRSHWVAKGPAGWRTAWDAEIINDVPNELIAWRTTEGAEVVSAGSAHFESGRRGRGTVVCVSSCSTTRPAERSGRLRLGVWRLTVTGHP
jgi:uncharacterized membrane protein